MGEFLADYLNLDVAAITNQLKEEGVGRVSSAKGGKYPWMGRTLAELGRDVETDHIDHYHGDFKHKH